MSAPIVPTNSPHLVPDPAPRSTTPDPAHDLQKTTDHVAHPQMTQAHEDDYEDDDDHTFSPRPAAVAVAAAAPTQTHCSSQHAVLAAHSGADAQMVGWTAGRRKNLDDMWMRAADGVGVHRHRLAKKGGPVRERKR